MNRLGFAPRDLDRVSDRLKAATEKCPSIFLEGVATHFSDGEDAGQSGGRTEEQLRILTEATSQFARRGWTGFKVHVANSSALRGFSAHSEGGVRWGARPGISLYGLENDLAVPPLGVKPALKLMSRLTHIQDVSRGARVSYGGLWEAKADTRVGVIPCGYADGYRRGLTGAFIAIECASTRSEHRVPVIGTVCMDYFMCDLTDVEAARVGDVAVLIGDTATLTASDLARRMGTISYEILTGISERVPRLYVDGSTSFGVTLNA